MLNRRIEENGLLEVLEGEGVGCIAFCPLAQGMLTNKYIEGIPEGSRATKQHGFLKRDQDYRRKACRLSGSSMRWLQNAIRAWRRWRCAGYCGMKP